MGPSGVRPKKKPPDKRIPSGQGIGILNAKITNSKSDCTKRKNSRVSWSPSTQHETKSSKTSKRGERKQELEEEDIPPFIPAAQTKEQCLDNEEIVRIKVEWKPGGATESKTKTLSRSEKSRQKKSEWDLEKLRSLEKEN